MGFGTWFKKRCQTPFFVVLCVVLLQGCTDEVQTVPVAEAWRQPLSSPITYIVQPGDTLYSIAWVYGLDYRQIAVSNAIKAPYAIHAGQNLRLCDKPLKPLLVKKLSKSEVQLSKVSTTNAGSSASSTSANTIKNQSMTKKWVPQPKTRVLPVKTAAVSGISWAWPARGCILCYFTETGLNKGINITSQLGSPITATADGKVVYAGNGLRGYGELIIIKHSDEFLSAYAHNQRILVQEDQVVKRGQIIALMGDSDAKCVMLHFEIRKAGKPVDPCYYLPR